MKTTAIIFLAVLSLCASCELHDKQNDPSPVTPPTPPSEQSEIPAALKGQWMYGNFSMTEFWAYDGSYQGNAFQTSVAFNFIPGGNFEMYFAASSTYYYCTTQAFTFKKGSVKFNDDHSFIIYPSEGRYRGYYSCASSSNIDRPFQPSELKPDTLYWSFENDSYGKEYLVIRNEINDGPSYFRPVKW